MKSLRQSILIWMATLLLVVGVVSTLGTYFYVRSEATGAVDVQLKQIAHFISSSGATRSGTEPAIDAPNPEDMFLIEVWDSKGLLTRSSHKTTKLGAPKLTGFADESNDGQNFRSYSFISSQNAVRVSLPSDVSDEQATNAAFQVALPAALIIPLSWLLLSYVIDRIFAPLDLAARRLRNSEEPVVLGDYPSEVAPFISANNDLIGRLKKIVEQQNQFVSNAAHELRTPLTAIALQIDNLRKFTTSKALMERVETLSAGSKRANQLVNHLLELARLDASKATENSENIGLSAAIDNVVVRMMPLAQQRKVRIQNHVGATANILAPKLETIGIVEALIENAILYSKRGGLVDVALAEINDGFQLTIQDQGIGIPEDKLPHVFERFYRAEPQATEGTGLGLAIAKANADKLGWHLTIANRLDRAGILATVNGKSLAS